MTEWEDPRDVAERREHWAWIVFRTVVIAIAVAGGLFFGALWFTRLGQ